MGLERLTLFLYSLLDNHHRSPEAVLLERGVLPYAASVLGFQLLQQSLAQHAVALAVYEHDLGAGALAIGIHGLLKRFQLVLQHLLVSQARGVIQERVYVQVHLYHAFLHQTVTAQRLLHLRACRLLRLVVLLQGNVRWRSGAWCGA